MKAALYDRFGSSDVLRIGDVPLPRFGAGEALVRVRAAALNPKDILIRMGKLPFFAAGRGFPKRVGFDWAGEIVALGGRDPELRIGDAVYGMIQSSRAGACASFATVRLDECARKPERLGFEEAAAVPLAAQTALQALRDLGRVMPGARVLVNGASGGVGTFAIQLARVMGAHVTTTSSAASRALCRQLGADVTLDYAKDDVLAAGPFDVFFDVFGNRPFDAARHALAPRGVWISTVLRGHVFAAMARSLVTSQRARLVVVRSRRRDLDYLAALLQEKRLVPIVDRVFGLDEIREAEERVATKHARGKVVVRIGDAT
jgi:NADPH:quinone reductase-like Zn-dependent oxidoreductase